MLNAVMLPAKKAYSGRVIQALEGTQDSLQHTEGKAKEVPIKLTSKEETKVTGMQPTGFGLSARSATDAKQCAFHVAEKRNVLDFVCSVMNPLISVNLLKQ
jgi:hypothetical protein